MALIFVPPGPALPHLAQPRWDHEPRRGRAASGTGGLSVGISSPGHVLAVDEAGATVALDGRIRRASTVLVPDLAVGDQVLIAAGTVIRRLDPVEAADLAVLIAIARDDAGLPNGRDFE